MVTNSVQVGNLSSGSGEKALIKASAVDFGTWKKKRSERVISPKIFDRMSSRLSEKNGFDEVRSSTAIVARAH